MTKVSINDVLDANDLQSLQLLLKSNQTLINNSNRYQIWSLLVPQPSFLSTFKPPNPNDFIEHRDYNQVVKDVSRSFIDLPNNEFLKKKLLKIIMSCLYLLPDIYYYQGFHDVCSIITIVFANASDEEAIKFLVSLTIRYLRDHCLENFNQSILYLHLIPNIIEKFEYHQNKIFHNLINIKNPLYSLSSIITLFSHDLSYDLTVKIWDHLFIFDDPSLPLFIYASMLIYYKDDLIDQLNEDQDIVQSILSKFIQIHLTNSLDTNRELNSILKLSLHLSSAINLSKLKYFKLINKYSSLKFKTSSLTVLKLEILNLNSSTIALNNDVNVNINSSANEIDLKLRFSRLLKLSTLILLFSLVYKSLKS